MSSRPNPPVPFPSPGPGCLASACPTSSLARGANSQVCQESAGCKVTLLAPDASSSTFSWSPLLADCGTSITAPHPGPPSAELHLPFEPGCEEASGQLFSSYRPQQRLQSPRRNPNSPLPTPLPPVDWALIDMLFPRILRVRIQSLRFAQGRMQDLI